MDHKTKQVNLCLDAQELGRSLKTQSPCALRLEKHRPFREDVWHPSDQQNWDVPKPEHAAGPTVLVIPSTPEP